MDFLGLFSPSGIQTKQTVAAEKIALRSRHDVWERVVPRVYSMSTAEAGGYVRARSAAIIHQEVDRAFEEDSSLKRAQRERLVQLATEKVIEVIVAQTRAVRPTTMRYRKVA